MWFPIILVNDLTVLCMEPVGLRSGNYKKLTRQQAKSQRQSLDLFVVHICEVLLSEKWGKEDSGWLGMDLGWRTQNIHNILVGKPVQYCPYSRLTQSWNAVDWNMPSSSVDNRSGGASNWSEPRVQLIEAPTSNWSGPPRPIDQEPRVQLIGAPASNWSGPPRPIVRDPRVQLFGAPASNWSGPL
jgi:hypothetical protein